MMQMLQVMLEDREAEKAERQANLAALQQLANNNQGHHDHPGSKLKNFQNTNPPVFSKTEEPLDADDWLQTMENNLEVAGVEENEKVLFATHYLAGPARAWWTSTRAMNAGQFITWTDFKLKFSKYHVPRTVLINIPFADLEALVDSAIQMEGKLHQASENRKRRMMNQSGSSHPEATPHQLSSNAVSPPAEVRPNNPHNRGGRLYHMNAEEAQEAPTWCWPYGRKCRTPNWSEVGDSQVFGPDVLREAEEKVHKIREYLKTAQSRQKSYADKRRREMTFEIGDFVYLKVSPLKGMQRFQLKGKLAPRYVGPFKILSRRGEVSYKLELPEEMSAVHNVFHISLLRKCLEVPEKTEVFKNIDHRAIDINKDLTYREVPIRILEEAFRTTRTRSIKFLKIQWSNHTEEEATWEREEDMKKEYPDLFST
ncbi:hypothetical protein QYE76_000297 [Lolium multiflorum]|uniref:Chromo domain-containing protein n=1 Tax=Lolium multiflorum TaxID=4521 RepID=A0AAD8VW85_LOLMU|nr:hypothetical protein QYE76_000297 [Lolium multiflorum]